jgi:hypothetical protein
MNCSLVVDIKRSLEEVEFRNFKNEVWKKRLRRLSESQLEQRQERVSCFPNNNYQEEELDLLNEKRTMK